MSAAIHFISAGAGSGKTFSLTQKLEQLLSSQQVAPAGVIATTFTKLAAGELKERVRGALVEAGQLRVANQMEQALIGTVNSVCGDILRRFAFEAGMPPDQQVLEDLKNNVTKIRPWVGVQVRTVDSELASYLGLDKAEGAVISGVLEDSPAEKAGLTEWDVIVGFNGGKVVTADDLVAAIKTSQIGQEVKLTVVRQRQQQTITVTVAEKPVNVG